MVIRLQRFFILLTMIIMATILSSLYLNYRINTHDVRQSMITGIRGDIYELGYVISKTVEKEGIHSAENLIYKSIATHKEYQEISLSENNRVFISSVRKNINQNISDSMSIELLSPDTIISDLYFTRKFDYYAGSNKEFFTLALKLDKDYIADIERNFLLMTYKISLLLIALLLGVLWWVYRLVVVPVLIISDDVRNENFTDSQFSIEEYNHLVTEFRKKFTEISEFSEVLEDTVSERTSELKKLNQLFNIAEKITHLGHLEWDIANAQYSWSDEVYRIFGLQPQMLQISYEVFLSMVHKNDRSQVEKSINDCLETRGGYYFTHRIVSADNTIKFVEQRGFVELTDDHQVSRIIGVVNDITELNKAQQEVRMLSKAVEDTDDIVTMTDPNGIIYFVNDSFVKHTGYSREEVIGRNHSFLKSGRLGQAFYKELWGTITSGNAFRARMINRNKEGEIYYEDKTITPLKNKQNEITSYVATGKVVTEQIKMEKELERLATTDQLTAVYNRRMFEALLDKALKFSNRYDESFALIFFDLDHFKNINDTFGHDTGDNILVSTVNVINEHIRSSDTLFRWGGEEFMIICPKVDRTTSLQLSEKLRHAVENEVLDDVGNITISVGVTLYNKSDSQSTIIKRVDRALYKSKASGRNMVSFLDYGDVEPANSQDDSEYRKHKVPV